MLFSSFILDTFNLIFSNTRDAAEKLSYVFSLDGVCDFVSALLFFQILSLGALLWLMPLWSLSAEWFTYLISVVSRMFHFSLKKLPILLVLSGILLLETFLEKNSEQTSEISPIFGYVGFGRAILGFGLGVLLKILHDNYKFNLIFSNYLLLSFSLLCLVFILIRQTFYQPLLTSLFYGIIIFSASKIELKSTVLIKFSRFFGALSYSVYLWHVVAFSVVIDLKNIFTIKSDFF